MNRFASGPKRHYYGKRGVVAYRLNRDGAAPSGAPIFGANVSMLLYGDAFWRTYTEGDNTELIATDSMKNFIQRETMNFGGSDLEAYVRFLADKFLGVYSQTEGLQISACDIPYAPLGGAVAFAPAGPERATARIESTRAGIVEIASGLSGFKLLRLSGSAFQGFVRDQYTTLPDLKNRPLYIWLDLEWRYVDADSAFTHGAVSAHVRQIVKEVFASTESGSIQQLIHRIGAALLAAVPVISEVDLEADNRTWDTIAEQGDTLGVYQEPRPAYGCLGLTLKRT